MVVLAADARDRHDNNFDFFRLMAAAFVIFYHSFGLLGIRQFSVFAFVGVSIFFIISGYFITLSWHRRPSLTSFAWNRFLRLIPALALVIVFTMIIIGPLATELPLTAYFTDLRTWLYAFNVPLLSPVFKLPEVFVHNAYPFEANGSIWTLQIEARMYAAIVLLGMTGLLGKKRWVMIGAGVAALIYLAYFELGISPQVLATIIKLPFLPMPIQDYRLPVLYSLLFMAGSLLYLYRDIVEYRPSVLAAVGLLWALSGFTQYFYAVTLGCLPYLVIGLGFKGIPLVKNITKHGDFSYGLYIFAFPVQQTIIRYFPVIGPWYLFGLSLPVTLLFAALSWKLVESRALQLKKHDPRHLLKKALQAPAIVARSVRDR